MTEEGDNLVKEIAGVQRSNREHSEPENLSHNNVQLENNNGKTEIEHNLFNQEIDKEEITHDYFEAMVLGQLMESLINAWPIEKQFSQQRMLEKV